MPDCSCRQKQRDLLPTVPGLDWTENYACLDKMRDSTDWVYNQARSETYRRSEPIDNEIDSSTGKKRWWRKRRWSRGEGRRRRSSSWRRDKSLCWLPIERNNNNNGGSLKIASGQVKCAAAAWLGYRRCRLCHDDPLWLSSASKWMLRCSRCWSMVTQWPKATAKKLIALSEQSCSCCRQLLNQKRPGLSWFLYTCIPCKVVKKGGGVGRDL